MFKKILSLPKYIIKSLYVCIAIIVIISIAMLSGVYWLSSDDGQEYVQKLIKEEFSNKVGYQIQANGIDFHFPLNAKISNLSLSDKKGKWLEVKNISINILLNPNIYKHLIITSFSIDNFYLLRSPMEAKNNSSNKSKEIKKQQKEVVSSDAGNKQDIKISIKGIDIKEIFLASSAINSPNDIKLSIAGSLLWNNLNQSLTFDNIIKLKKIVKYVSPVEIKLTGKYILKDVNNKFDQIIAQVNTGKIEVTLPSSLSDIPKSSSSKNNSSKAIISNSNKSNPKGQAIALDVKLKIDNNVYIHGFGLDIVMGGDLRVTGDSNDPKVRGKLSIVDGIFNEFGKNFDIKKADLLFDGNIPPYPYLDVVASTTQAGIEIILTLSGPILSPSFNIKSSSSLNSKEIIAKLLFGENLSKINSSQAKKLTESLKKMDITNDSGSKAIDTIKSLFNKNKAKTKDTKDQNNNGDSNNNSPKDLKTLLENELNFKF